MGRPKAGELDIRVLQRTNSGTYTISLPLSMVQELNWREGQKLQVSKKGKSLTFKDA